MITQGASRLSLRCLGRRNGGSVATCLRRLSCEAASHLESNRSLPSAFPGQSSSVREWAMLPQQPAQVVALLRQHRDLVHLGRIRRKLRTNPRQGHGRWTK